MAPTSSSDARNKSPVILKGTTCPPYGRSLKICIKLNLSCKLRTSLPGSCDGLGGCFKNLHIAYLLVYCLIILQPRAVDVNFEIEFITTNLVDVVLLLLGKSQDVECLVGKSHILLVVNRINRNLKK